MDDDFDCAHCGAPMSEHGPDDLFGDPRHLRCRRPARDECPAGGPHSWVIDSPDDYYLATGVRRSTRRQRTHCDECGAPAPEGDDR